MQVSKHFESHEIVPPEIHDSPGLQDRWFISDWQLRIAELFRERFGPTIINDYGWGGNVYANGITYELSGTRPPRMDIIGAAYSQHKLAMALDLKFRDASPDEVREDMMANQEMYINEGVTTIESGEIADTWVHVDGRPWQDRGDTIVVVGT